MPDTGRMPGDGFAAECWLKAAGVTKTALSGWFVVVDTIVEDKDEIEEVCFVYPDLRAGFQDSRARRPATRNMQALCSSDWTTKPSRS
jgi:hypothetical protein